MIALLAALACVRPPPPPAPPPTPSLRPGADTDLVYFVLVDRFANGDPSNDQHIDLADPQAFHGGDLQGVLDHLDYLSDLGVGTVWLSPIFEMRTEPFHGWGAFHGYWVRDLTRVEPRFGDLALLQQLGQALDARGMRLVLDMVWNHVGFDAPLRQTHPDWFHPDHPIEDWDDPDQLENHTVHGLPDLAQENPEVYDHLRDASLYWAREAGVDGYRVDAVRHLPSAFLRQISDELHATLGEDFWLLGEDFQGDALSLAESQRAGGFDAMFDFPLRYAMVDVYCHGRGPGRLASVLSADRFYDDPGQLVTFLDNHDLPRVTTECGGARWRVDQALLFQFLTRGTPAMTWGSELYLEGGEEPENRRDMPWAQAEGPSWVAALQRLRQEQHPGEGVPWILAVDDTLFATVRVQSHGASLVAVNTGEAARALPLSPELEAAEPVSWLEAGPEGARIGAPPAGALMVPPQTTVGVLYRSDTSTGFHAIASARREAARQPTEVTLRADLALDDGERLVVVGAGPELGNWDPARGVELHTDEGGAQVGAVSAPMNAVLAFKLVRVSADGAVTWQEGEDRVHLVQGSDTVALRW
ncbi:MAG: glycosyl hydrolase [Alphaproteobacteria bacterium]|nr:glycosyl hydrolase [Alphaproteobacteria bacterium]